MRISASILSIKDNLKENVLKLTKTDIDYIHLDIMDGKFVTNKTWNIDEIKKIINHDKPLDVHLMVDDIKSYVDDFKTLNPEYITFHYEASHDIMEAIKYIKDLNIKVGISIKPNTDVNVLVPYLPFIDLVLVMSVKPGQGGQKFISSSKDKIEQLVSLRGDYKYLIEVDGGINVDTVLNVKKADIIVVGSYITNGDYSENIKNLKEKIYG